MYKAHGSSIKKRRLFFFARINLMKYLVLNFIHLDKEENYFSRHTSSVVVHLAAVMIIRRMGKRKEEKYIKNMWVVPAHMRIKCWNKSRIMIIFDVFPPHFEVLKWITRAVAKFRLYKKSPYCVIGSEKKGNF